MARRLHREEQPLGQVWGAGQVPRFSTSTDPHPPAGNTNIPPSTVPVSPQSQDPLPFPLQRTTLPCPTELGEWAAPRHTEQAGGSCNPPHLGAPFTLGCTGAPAPVPVPTCTTRFSACLEAALPLSPPGPTSQLSLVHLLSGFQNVANLPSCSFRPDGALSRSPVPSLSLTSLLSFGGILTGAQSSRYIQSTLYASWELPTRNQVRG